MSTHENKTVVLRVFNEAMNNRDFSIVEEIIDEHSTHHGLGQAITGAKGFTGLLEQFLQGFPDMKINVENAVAEDDFVATKGSWTGTHEGDFMGMKGTGRSVKVGYMDMWRMENGKCVENWVQMDIAGLMQQLGTSTTAVIEA